MVKKSQEPENTEKPFEELMKDLEAEVRSLESGDLTLDNAMASFEKGMKLARECEKKLAQAKSKVEKIISDENGMEKDVPFAPAD
jgi:exodeoxyribonuclease VII small subunit